MSTIKPRINITVEPSVKKAILAAADRDKMPIASKAHDLLCLGLEIEEDIALAKLADKRSVKGTRFIPHSKVWK